MYHSEIKRFGKKVLLLLLIIIFPISLSAVDFGLITNVFTGLDNSGTAASETDNINPLELKIDLLPRLSFLIGDNAELFLSAGLSWSPDENFVPEILRTEFSIRFGNSGIRAGRITYSDPLSFIVSGLFDGLHFYNNSAAGRFNAGVWYTGLLYKKHNEITMTSSDQELFYKTFTFDDFDTYFAPKRMFAVLEWDHPSIGEFLHLNIAAIGQMDFNKTDKYHNQFFILKAGIPVRSLLFELGGAFEISQKSNGNDFDIAMAYAGDFGLSWMLPTNIVSRLSLTGRIAGENFTPITTKYFGSVIKEKMSGLSVISLDYLIRLSSTLGMNLTASCFIRNDQGTLTGPATELFARLVWSPVSDVQFNLGGGAFLPFLSHTNSDDKLEWRAELSAILALY
jgi:hypothetical protein